ncbi:flagellar biosynthesis protein FlhF [Tepidanaerobacter sp. GT38]|uniref:flagellar biosynthesis protein FlhF n=1 Tax=Tepidanaerobacter sp. GT38 TaxID=2722793 RepID=UPI001F004F2D|nr:flagellar biosynthesis protein FlhF [Tepidanaerobacter sp. GT38]MCG1011730.1 flagellar biosynthesis protein FlhF [Tepidanaerobacter sp. GT38]
MKIKTYVADNIQEAFYKVKTDLGKDAVILKTKHIKKGGFMGLFAKKMVEVVAANDIKPTVNFPIMPDPTPLPHANLKPKESASITEIEDIKTDIEEVKKLLSKLYSDKKQRDDSTDIDMPKLLKKYQERMYEMEIDPGIINMLIDNTKKALTDSDLNNETLLYETLKQEIALFVDEIEPIPLSKENNIVVFVGPTGVGKTTTIAKLAAHYVLYKNKKVAMITADTFRVGAIEQLQHYGDLLEIPVHVVYRPEEVKEILSELKGYDLLLVDTMGFSPNNRIQIKKIKNLLDVLNPDDIHIVISAATKNRDMVDILNNYKELGYKKILITKLDETKSYGMILNALKMTGCKLSYFTMGQNVPDDIEIASADKIAEMILGAKEDV